MHEQIRPEQRPRQDNGPSRKASRLGNDLIMGLRFFSRLPTGDHPHERPDLGRIALALPFASLVIGIGPALLLMLACWLGIPATVAAVLAVGALVLATGAMTEDALADSADGLAGGSTVEQRLEIMKDSRHGTYGVAALCLFIVLRVAALAAVAAANPLAAAATWLATGILSRSAALWLSVDLPAARQGGSSASVGRVTKREFGIGALFAAVLGFVLAAPFVGIIGLLLTLAAIAATAWGWTTLCRRLIGGQTGDLIGALQALMETAAFTVLLIFL